MKKIIATVLAMVMALALCTTAFAASAYGTGNTIPSVSTAASYELKDGAGAYKDNVATYFVHTTDNATKAVSVSDAMVKVTKHMAEYTIVVDTNVTYLAPAATFGTGYDDTGAVVATVNELKNCGDIKLANSDEVLYVGDTDGKLYICDHNGTYTLLVDGLLVKVSEADDATDYSEKEHKYVVTTAKKDGKTVVTALSCSACNTTFTFKDSAADAVKAFGVGNFTETVVTVTDAAQGTTSFTLYIKDAEATTTTGATTGTATSPKTFDAGIAMYVGMALTSVAGSAVVIGKKKEF